LQFLCCARFQNPKLLTCLCGSPNILLMALPQNLEPPLSHGASSLCKLFMLNH
jgi:hypothetical protein